MRILVLGNGPGATNARRLAQERGFRLARHALDSVTYIVTDQTVNPRDPKLVAARALGVHVMPDNEFAANPDFWPEPAAEGRSRLVPHFEHGHLGRRDRRDGRERTRSPEVQHVMDSLFSAINNADPTAVRRAMRNLASILWALSPLLTAGLSAPIIFGHAASKLKSVLCGIAAAVYAGLAIGYITLFALDAQSLGDGQFGDINPIALISMFAVILGSTAHAFMIRTKVFPHDEEPRPTRRIPTDDVEARALARRERREHARRLLKEDPALADELGIGRPDLGLGYDDGGLVDINHASAPTLLTMRGIDEETAERIVQLRGLSGPFASTEELIVRADLNPEALRLVDEYAVYA